MFINFDVNISVDFMYSVNAELSITGNGVLYISLDDLVDNSNFYSLYSERGVDGLRDFIFDTYLNDEGFDEDRIILDENDLKEVFNAYLEEKNHDNT